MVKNIVVAATLFSTVLCNGSASNVIAGYLDATATGSSLKVNMSQASQDGYNMVIFGFAKIDGINMGFYDSASQNVIQQKVVEAKSNKMRALISIGGQVNTFNPGALSDDEITTLATNIVNFLHENNFDGIDFDVEVKTDPVLFLHLLQNIKQLDQNILLTAAPQINNGKLVTTGDNQDYQLAINDGLFDFLFLQEYNTPPQNNISYISSIYPVIKSQVPSNTKIVTGEPTSSAAAGSVSVYHPSAGQTLNTQDVTVMMLPELKKIHDDDQFGGVMGWSLNVEYDPADYGDPSHVPGTYAYGLKDCVLSGQCDVPPAPKPVVMNYTLQTSDTDSASGLGVILTISDADGNSFTTDYIAPNSNKVYNANTNPSAADIEGRSNLKVQWSTYPGGPCGDCPGSFDFDKNMNIMVNPTYKSCDFKELPSDQK